MKRKWNGKKFFHKCVLALLLVALLDLVYQKEETQSSGEEKTGSWKTYLAHSIGTQMLDTWIPAFSFADSGGREGNLFQEILEQQFPVLAFGMESGDGTQIESGNAYEKILLQEGSSEYTESERGESLEIPESSDGRIQLDDEMTRLLMEENGNSFVAGEENSEVPKGTALGQVSGNGAEHSELAAFEKASAKQQEYNWSYYQDFDALVKEFYAVDATTEVNGEQLNVERLRGMDMTIEKDPSVPQILIYHTHSQETFADSIEGEESTTIVGAGELLTQILQEEYGYNVLHCRGKFDVEERDYAYSNALPVIEQLLNDNPTIEVVIDLHRDEMLEGRKLVTELNGRPTARLMFFNGLSHTREQGDIEYLENPYIDENLAFSFQMQVAANEYYPDLTRRIYLKGYRYNMHLCPKSLLIELGAQTNTVEEIKNACYPIAHILDMVLSG